jgi:hypothetical protein
VRGYSGGRTKPSQITHIDPSGWHLRGQQHALRKLIAKHIFVTNGDGVALPAPVKRGLRQPASLKTG